jgi:hypothetical protein
VERSAVYATVFSRVLSDSWWVLIISYVVLLLMVLKLHFDPESLKLRKLCNMTCCRQGELHRLVAVNGEDDGEDDALPPLLPRPHAIPDRVAEQAAAAEAHAAAEQVVIDTTAVAQTAAERTAACRAASDASNLQATVDEARLNAAADAETTARQALADAATIAHTAVDVTATEQATVEQAMSDQAELVHAAAVQTTLAYTICEESRVQAANDDAMHNAATAAQQIADQAAADATAALHAAAAQAAAAQTAADAAAAEQAAAAQAAADEAAAAQAAIDAAAVVKAVRVLRKAGVAAQVCVSLTRAELAAIGEEPLDAESTETGCVVCRAKKLQIAFLPCGHVCCASCTLTLMQSRGVARCPICRLYSASFIRIFQ